MQIYAEKAPKYVWRLGCPCPDPQGELMRSPRARTPSRNGRPTSKGRERRGGGLFLRGTEGRQGEFPQSQGENNKYCLKVITFCSCLYLITFITRSAWYAASVIQSSVRLSVDRQQQRRPVGLLLRSGAGSVDYNATLHLANIRGAAVAEKLEGASGGWITDSPPFPPPSTPSLYNCSSPPVSSIPFPTFFSS